MEINKLKSILHYIINYYPYNGDLTKTRLTKLVYLIDWESSKKFGKQMTNIKWYFDHYGPYVSDVLDLADVDKDVKIEKSISAFGGIKYTVRRKNEDSLLDDSGLTEEDKKIVDLVIKNTKQLTWNKFIDYVYDTEPVVNSQRYNDLDLPTLAEQLNTNK